MENMTHCCEGRASTTQSGRKQTQPSSHPPLEYDASGLGKLKEAYDWAHDEMGLDEDEGLRYAKKKAKPKR